MLIFPHDQALAKIGNIIESLLEKKERVIIAIDGMSASGKTTFARDLGNAYTAEIIQMDDFFLQDHQRTESRLAEIGGNVDYERFMNQVIANLIQKDAFAYEAYDCRKKTMSEKYFANDHQVVIVEGAYSLRRDFRFIYDLKILFQIDEKKQRERVLKRNRSMYRMFVDTWIPMENKYIEGNNLKRIADVIIKV